MGKIRIKGSNIRDDILNPFKIREIPVLDSHGEGGGEAILNEIRIAIFSELLMSSLYHLGGCGANPEIKIPTRGMTVKVQTCTLRLNSKPKERKRNTHKN